MNTEGGEEGEQRRVVFKSNGHLGTVIGEAHGLVRVLWDEASKVAGEPKDSWVQPEDIEAAPDCKPLEGEQRCGRCQRPISECSCGGETCSCGAAVRDDGTCDGCGAQIVPDCKPPSEGPTSDLPPELAKALRDRSVTVPADARVFKRIEEWRNAPSNTMSALPPPSEGEEGEPKASVNAKIEELRSVERACGRKGALIDMRDWDPGHRNFINGMLFVLEKTPARDSRLTKEQQERLEAQAEAGRGLLEVLERLLGAPNSEAHGDHVALSRGEYGRAVRNLEALAAAFGEESR